MVEVTFADLQSQFLVLPKGGNFGEYPAFQHAYELLKRHTSAFSNFTEATVWVALEENALAFVVLRTILGMTPPEWAELARTERAVNVPQGAARDLDVACHRRRDHLSRLMPSRAAVTIDR